eukprot:gene10834-7505_t
MINQLAEESFVLQVIDTHKTATTKQEHNNRNQSSSFIILLRATMGRYMNQLPQRIKGAPSRYALSIILLVITGIKAENPLIHIYLLSMEVTVFSALGYNSSIAS